MTPSIARSNTETVVDHARRSVADLTRQPSGEIEIAFAARWLRNQNPLRADPVQALAAAAAISIGEVDPVAALQVGNLRPLFAVACASHRRRADQTHFLDHDAVLDVAG